MDIMKVIPPTSTRVAVFTAKSSANIDEAGWR
jgi:hypothetical protein